MNRASSPRRLKRGRTPRFGSSATLITTALAIVLSLAIARSFLTRQRDQKGCSMSWMRPAFAHFADFDAEHTRLAGKYSLYLYREGLVDEDTRVKGVPVLFIPGNAGSYKQVRPLAAQAALHYQSSLQYDEQAKANGKIPLDFFAVDFNEDFAAFHGQTLLDQAEYVNDAISYILALYLNPHRSIRDSNLPDPASIILVGHSMGGIVARTAITLPDYQFDSVNTIITLATPHARAPISFDQDILNIYNRINDYWRYSYSHRLEANNPLWETTLVSIAGGSLDTVVPSDYSTLASLVPQTHGFTVFTSSIPQVWTSMDHLAITWCNQLREVVVSSIYDVIDARDVSQTISREGRMQAFREHFLSGLEDYYSQPSLSKRVDRTLLKIDSASSSYASLGERLIIRSSSFSQYSPPKAHLMPIPPRKSGGQDVFRLLTNQRLLEHEGYQPSVLFCRVLPQQDSSTEQAWAVNIDMSKNAETQKNLSCVNAASDSVLLPSSYSWNQQPFDHYLVKEWNKLVHNSPPFSFLQYDLVNLAEFEFVAIIDSAPESSTTWVIAEFASRVLTSVETTGGTMCLMLRGVQASFPARSMFSEIKIPSIHSSLLAFKIKVDKQTCSEEDTTFTPLLRQHIDNPYESKFTVNVQDTGLSIHGVAPYIPTPLRPNNTFGGLLLQIWSDPSCKAPLNVDLRVDVLGSLGKLWMRYRTVFASFPLTITALIVRNQFSLYDQTGTFVSFSESLDLSLRTSIPIFVGVLTVLGLFSSKATGIGVTMFRLGYAPEAFVDFTRNDLLLGLQDPFFWFLIPLFGIISVGVCVLSNYAILGLTFAFNAAFDLLAKFSGRTKSRPTTTFAVTPLRRRLLMLAALLVLVSVFVPYQFLYLVLCAVQLATCTRALKLARESRAANHIQFYNYAHAIFMFMLWILPINAPTLIVWIHNLAVHWRTPFTSHHSIVSIAPFILLVETISAGQPIPRLDNGLSRHITSFLMLFLAGYSSVFGITYAYRLHDIASLIFMWLTAIHLSVNGWTVEGVRKFFHDFNSGNLALTQKLKMKP